MKADILNAELDGDDWERRLADFPVTDVYYSAGYMRAAALHQGGEPMAFSAGEGDWNFFLPGLLREVHEVGNRTVPSPCRDIETAYGYGGPLVSHADPALLSRAWELYGEWCRCRNVVAEFTRFHPLLGNHVSASPDCRLTFDRQTVVLPLDGGPEDLEARASGNHRNMVRKALKAGLAAREETGSSESLSEFVELYNATMQRLDSSADYYFGTAYFTALQVVQPRLFTVRQGERLAAAGLFFQHGAFFHYHLGGSDPEFRSLAATNLLLHAAACAAQAEGCRQFHLGGGRTAASDDSLRLFKKSISPRENADFYLGRLVHLPQRYNELCAMWREQAGGHPIPSRFFLYRLPLPADSKP